MKKEFKLVLCLIIILGFTFLLSGCNSKQILYDKAMREYENGEYLWAYTHFNKLHKEDTQNNFDEEEWMKKSEENFTTEDYAQILINAGK